MDLDVFSLHNIKVQKVDIEPLEMPQSLAIINTSLSNLKSELDIKLKQSPIRVPLPLLPSDIPDDPEPLGDVVIYKKANELHQDDAAMDLEAVPPQDIMEQEAHMDMEPSELPQALPSSPIPTPVTLPETPTKVKFEPIDIIDLTKTPQRPSKRQRIFMDAVVVPTLAEIRHRYQQQEGASINEIYEKLEKLKNPKVKKNENLVLHRDTIRERLRSVGYDLYPIPLDKHIQDVTVTRQFMSCTYGGNTQQTFPNIGKKFLEKHGLNDFMYLSLSFNPHAPEVPGAPGLYFSPGGRASDEKRAWPDIQRTFVRLTSGIWLYVGQYKMSPVASLTQQEWAAQTDNVRNTWASEICTREWGWEVLARVSMRLELEREPTDEDLIAALAAKTQYSHVTQKQVSRAFLLGEESVAVYTMECVDYDVDF